ncbi:hypothetical protein F5148DRAFT_1288800 [Russula earlei]|uniref:Uncharacterized protein n=1 Tax=Russula earlei TaxID=71964 RepID=A0ACC0TYX1_9AGAM|nr:hypothetical protein F5148DRAFT_1288800 [Russula earlei]
MEASALVEKMLCFFFSTLLPAFRNLRWTATQRDESALPRFTAPRVPSTPAGYPASFGATGQQLAPPPRRLRAYLPRCQSRRITTVLDVDDAASGGKAARVAFLA